ncbi:MAG: phosphoglucomutase/phosphomannomutase family protein [Ignavibacteriae bacterium]|nr:phosphoglucomutase/phosphomannomutase family protein [Ignavibacteriota bacterium]
MISFGTDGWRGLIARDFTFANLEIVAVATARLLKKMGKKKQSVVIGYDTRFLSKEFAEETAQILAYHDITAHVTETFSSTPQVSFHTKQKGTDLGIIITASHNPPQYNGFKIKANFGGPATPETVSKLEAEVKKLNGKVPKLNMKPYDFYLKTREIRYFDAKEPYIRYIKKKIDLEAIINAEFKIIYDPMHGAGIDTMKMILQNVRELHEFYNPSFGNIHHPEPMPDNLYDLMEAVKGGGYDIGIATDGDADRLGAVDNEGNFVDSHKVFMILLKYLYEKKKKRGAVAKTVSLTSMVNKYCEKHSIKLYETPVGFKHIAKLMTEDKILIGGEESGGLGTILHIPERDGIFNGMLLLEVMAVRKKTLKQLCDELDEEFGLHRYLRRDVKVTQQQKDAILSGCEKMPKKLGRFNVLKIDTKDGYKFFTENGWLLIRASGTEPLIRFYAESDSLCTVNELLDEGMKIKK